MNRNISIDLLKLLMAFMVIGLHTGFLNESTELGEFLLSQGLFRIAVPVFFIINGYFFYFALVKRSQFLWFKRVVILYLVWMAFYSVIWVSLPDISLMSIFRLITTFLIGYHHLWYVSGMIGAAILVTLLHSLGTKFLASCIGITFILGVLIQYIGNYHVFPGTLIDQAFNSTSFHRNFLFFAFPFFCIGFLIRKHSISEEISIKVALFAVILGILLLLSESYINYIQPQRDVGFDNCLSLIVASPAIFILFLKQNVKGSSKNIALYSSAIFFIHSFVLSVLTKFTELTGTNLTVATIAFSAIASIFIINLNKRVKFIL